MGTVLEQVFHMNRDRTISAARESTPETGLTTAAGRPIKVLHVEVGGSYGGSLRALELYLRYSDPNRFTHDVLFYYPTPGAEKLRSVACKMVTLYKTVPEKSRPLSEAVWARPWTHLKSTTAGRSLIELRNWIGVLTAWGTARQIAILLRQERYDVIHVNNTFTYQLPTLLAAKRAHTPVLAYIRNPVLNRRFARCLMRMADTIVSDSQFHEKALASWGMAVPLTTCYNAVELQVPDSISSSQLRESLLGGNKVLIGSLGRLDEQKGYHDLIRAARIVIDARPDVRFAVAGEGPLRRSLETLIAKLDLADHFQLCGFRSDAGTFLAAIDIFVSSSHWEGLPLAIVEAMLLGRPVVATDVGGTSEVVVPDRTGALIPAGSPELLAKAILSTITKKTETLALASAAKKLAAASFDPASVTRRFDNILSVLGLCAAPL